MDADLRDLQAYLAVLRAGGFREGARASGHSASRLSESVRRLEAALGVRLLHRTTRSIAPTEAGARLAERLAPALGEVRAALDVIDRYRDGPAGTLRLNVPATAARIVLPPLAYPNRPTWLTLPRSMVRFEMVLPRPSKVPLKPLEALSGLPRLSTPIGAKPAPPFQLAVAEASMELISAQLPERLAPIACSRVRFETGSKRSAKSLPI